MRRVAQELGTGPASLYAHVSGKDELLELMLERISGEIRLPGRPEPERWKEQIKEVCREAQRVYTAHRDITVVSLGGIQLGPNKLKVAEFVVGLLLSAASPGRSPPTRWTASAN
ncbi:TetR/AcrR family transcriptional regulator [Kitasatospora arboriphila]